MIDPQDDPIALVPSRFEHWQAAFEQEQDRVIALAEARGFMSDIQRIEHVGSTAIPHLAAKDIVDLDIVVNDSAVNAVARAIAVELGGTRFQNTDRWHPVFRIANGQRFNDHVFAASSDRWKVSVLTREMLVEDCSLRTEYEELKMELCTEHDELGEYSRAKTAFFDRLLAQAQHAPHLEVDFDLP